jgi:hypothetical protein
MGEGARLTGRGLAVEAHMVAAETVTEELFGER